MRTLFPTLALLAAAPAAATTTLLTETFDAENGGSGRLTYAGFAQFEVVGSVDLIRSGDYGITCPSGSCVDLDGSGSGELRTRAAFAIKAGDRVTLSFDLAGNGRIPTADPFAAGFLFDTAFAATDIGGTGPAGSDFAGSGGSFAGTRLFRAISALASGAPAAGYTLRFTAAQAGTVRAFLGTASNDAHGPILDNVSLTLDAAAVPEPATWTTMALGFGLAGGALRRRTRRPAAG